MFEEEQMEIPVYAFETQAFSGTVDKAQTRDHVVVGGQN